ncbi:gas vesicle protein [Streptomyces vietnamensis]|uniref:gas vesicle protein GvpO n=1 Tax=Streptomyces vietnamensis TaxID=362257 RepID=UPI00341679DB
MILTNDTGRRKKDDPEESKPDTDSGSETEAEVDSDPEAEVEAETDSPETVDRVSPAEAMRNAIEQLTELLGRSPESVSALKPTENGWTAQVEVLEIERIPETTSVLASYEVALSADGQLLGYERGKRYTRAQVDQNGR